MNETIYDVFYDFVMEKVAAEEGVMLGGEEPKVSQSAKRQGKYTASLANRAFNEETQEKRRGRKIKLNLKDPEKSTRWGVHPMKKRQGKNTKALASRAFGTGIKHRFGRALGDVKDYVKDNPGKSIGIGAGVAAAGGLGAYGLHRLLRKKKKQNGEATNKAANYTSPIDYALALTDEWFE